MFDGISIQTFSGKNGPMSAALHADCMQLGHQNHYILKSLNFLKFSRVPFRRCEQCGQVMKTRAAFSSHIQYHNNLEQFTCKICGHVLKSKQKFDNHMQTHNKKQLAQRKCRICSKLYANFLSWDHFDGIFYIRFVESSLYQFL